MTPNERNLDALYDFLDEKVKQLESIRYKLGEEKITTTTSDKIQIRKLRLKK